MKQVFKPNPDFVNKSGRDSRQHWAKDFNVPEVNALADQQEERLKEGYRLMNEAAKVFSELKDKEREIEQALAQNAVGESEITQKKKQEGYLYDLDREIGFLYRLNRTV